MRRLKFFAISSYLLVNLLGATSSFAQQSFQLSSKFFEVDLTRTKFWDGEHRFGNVFCLQFPRSTDAQGLAYALYNNNTLYFSRAAYGDMTALYVATSTVPAGRSVEVEIGNLESKNQKDVDTHPGNFKQSRTSGVFGPSLTLIIRNSKEGPKESLFPFSRSFSNSPDGLLSSVSVHRLFVHGHDRIELAGLRYLKAPASSEREADEISDLLAFVEAAANSLQSCTANLPARSQ
jgi:hypothetical protein